MHERHVAHELKPVDRRLEVGIVLASVSIIARRRWLLGAGATVAAAGTVVLAIGLLV